MFFLFVQIKQIDSPFGPEKVLVSDKKKKKRKNKAAMA